MTNRPPTFPRNSVYTDRDDSDASEGSLLTAILPFQSIPWILLLLLVFPLAVIAGDSLLSPLYAMFWLTLFPMADTLARPEFSLVLVIKLLMYFPIAFMAIGLLMTKILTTYHRAWTAFVAQPHTMHVAYHPDKRLSTIALVHWVFYRWVRILRKPLLLLLLSCILFGLFLFLLQWFTKPLALFFMIALIVVLFALALTVFFLAVSLLQSGASYLKTCYGSTAAILEPEQSCEVLYTRVGRICFNSPWVAMVYLQQMGFVAVFIFSVIFTTSQYDVHSFVAFEPALLKLVLLNGLLLLVLLVLYASKFFLYSDALNRFYDSVAMAGMESSQAYNTRRA